MVFTIQHKSFMVESYFRNGSKIDGQWQYSLQDCLEEFRNEFPNFIFDYDSFRHTVTHSVMVFRETGSVKQKEGAGRAKKRTEELVNNVREIINNAPRTSVRALSQQVGVSIGTCHTILKKDLHLFPYRMTCYQEIKEIDYPRRITFSQWFLNNFDNELLDKTFFSDESWFYLNGYVNSQNMRMWTNEKPDNFFVETTLHPQKIGVWCAISRRRIIGPIFFNGTLTGERYRQEIIMPFIEQLDDEEITQGYFQQDGARAHTAGETINMLQQFFQNRLITLNTEHEFPPRSCDITPCDFFLWPFLKNSIYRVQIPDLADLQIRIAERINGIDNAILQNVFSSIRRRCEKCFEQGGGHFEQFL